MSAGGLDLFLPIGTLFSFILDRVAQVAGWRRWRAFSVLDMLSRAFSHHEKCATLLKCATRSLILLSLFRW
jgi:hypothetical protein